MKRVLASIGRIVLVMAVYYAAQLAIAVMAGVAFGVYNGFSGFDLQTQDVLRFIASRTPQLILFAAIIAAACYYVIYRDRREDARAFFRIRPLDAGAVIMLVFFGIGTNALMELLVMLMQKLPFYADHYEEYVEMTSMIFGDSVFFTFLSAGVVGPILEEIMFRGLIFGELRKIMPIKIALVVQALLFGVYHIDLIQGTYAAIIGLFLGFVYYRTGSMIAPTVVHMAVNLFSFVMNAFFPAPVVEANWGLILLVGVLCFILSGVYILISRNFRYVMDDGLYRHARRQDADPAGTSRQV